MGINLTRLNKEGLFGLIFFPIIWMKGLLNIKINMRKGGKLPQITFCDQSSIITNTISFIQMEITKMMSHFAWASQLCGIRGVTTSVRCEILICMIKRVGDCMKGILHWAIELGNIKLNLRYLENLKHYFIKWYLKKIPENLYMYV